MKNKFSFFLLLLAALSMLVSCKDEPGSNSKLTFKSVNIADAKALALVQETTPMNAPARLRAEEEKPETKFLYTVDENNNMSAAVFYFNEVDSTTNTKALRLSIENIFEVGNDYLWLFGCQYYCDDIESLPAKVQDFVSQQIEASRTRTGHFNYLIRKTDGALFNLTDITLLPINWEGKIEICYQSLDNPTSNDLRQYGMITQVDKEIFFVTGNFQGGIKKLVDVGNTMDVVNLDYHANVAYALSDEQGHLGSVLSYESNVPTTPVFIDGNNAYPVQGLPSTINEANPTMHCIGGKYFISHGYNSNSSLEPAIYTVSIDNGTATATLCVAGHKLPDYSYGYPVKIDGDTYSYLSSDMYGNAIVETFNANTSTFTQEQLPDGFPSWPSAYDEEGNANSIEFDKQTTFDYVIIYNLPTRTATRHDIDRSQVPQYNYNYGVIYNRSLKGATETVILTDGSSVTLFTPFTGDNAFVTTIMGNEASGTAVVSTLVRLN